jgi:hypothetical protein
VAPLDPQDGPFPKLGPVSIVVAQEAVPPEATANSPTSPIELASTASTHSKLPTSKTFNQALGARISIRNDDPQHHRLENGSDTLRQSQRNGEASLGSRYDVCQDNALLWK